MDHSGTRPWVRSRAGGCAPTWCSNAWLRRSRGCCRGFASSRKKAGLGTAPANWAGCRVLWGQQAGQEAAVPQDSWIIRSLPVIISGSAGVFWPCRAAAAPCPGAAAGTRLTCDLFDGLGKGRGLGLLAGGSPGLQQSRQEHCWGLRERVPTVGGDRDTCGWVCGRGHPSPCKHTSIALCPAPNLH